MPRVNEILFIFLTLLFVFGCSSADKRSDTAEGSYSIAQEYEKDDRYEEAIKRYQEVKNKFPYSKYAIMAELAIADVYYKQESFAEAQVAYQSFKDLHPKHAKIDYVTFRLGMSYYNQLPTSIDRDLTLASSAILYLDEVIKSFPQSGSLAEAKEKKASALKMLAEKEMYIANFYFVRDMFDSALQRYESMLKKYPNSPFEAQALSRGSISASRIGDSERARRLLSALKEKFPNSSEAAKANEEVK